MGMRKMASVSFALLVMTLVMSMQQGVMAFKELKVGGPQAWHVPDGNDTTFYNEWAGSKRFHVGDSLNFQYQNDSVLVVDKYGYFHCDVTKASTSFYDGNTMFKLEQPGFVYFISGSVENCRSGQRMEVDVMSTHPPHPHPVAAPPEPQYQDADAPAPASEAYAPAENLGLQLVPVAQVSAFMGLATAASVFLF